MKKIISTFLLTTALLFTPIIAKAACSNPEMASQKIVDELAADEQKLGLRIEHSYKTPLEVARMGEALQRVTGQKVIQDTTVQVWIIGAEKRPDLKIWVEIDADSCVVQFQPLQAAQVEILLQAYKGVPAKE